jgi:myo-inositol-1(or 4)-monophosphatase
MESPLEFAIQLAQKTGELLVEHFNLQGTQAETKSDNTLVTQADLAADRFITAEIHRQYPDDMILSEESNTQSGNSDRPVWVIDPLDGTTNFSLGLPIWGVSIGRLVDGYPHTAVVYFPVIDELYSAQVGKGAFFNHQELITRRPPASQTTSFFACCSRTARRYNVNLRYKTRILGAAAYDLCCVARNAAIASMEITPKIWDLAAAWLILKEAGGAIDVLEGTNPFPIQPSYDYRSTSYPVISAADEEILEKLRSSIQKR